MKKRRADDLNRLMAAKFHPAPDDIARDYAHDILVLRPLIEKHGDWAIKRREFHRWEVRWDDSWSVAYGETLEMALCEALLQDKVKA